MHLVLVGKGGGLPLRLLAIVGAAPVGHVHPVYK
jgi:hypothetical protein